MRTQTALRTIGALALLFSACSNRAEAKTGDVGDSLRPFIVKNCDTGQQYCQVCAFSGRPTLMAVGDLSDKTFEEDLLRIQKLVDANKAKGLSAFALLGKIEGDRLMNAEDEKKAMEELKATRTRLGLSFPVVILPAKMTESELKNYTKFNDAYAIKGSRTILLATADSKVVFADKIEAAKAEQQFKSLEETIQKSL